MLLLSLCFVPFFGLIGASVATTVAYTMDLVLRLKAFDQVTQSGAFINIVPKLSDFKLMLSFAKGIRKNAR